MSGFANGCRWVGVVFGGLLLAGLAWAGAPGAGSDYQKSADNAKWDWSDGHASPLHCATQGAGKYDVSLVSTQKDRSALTIQVAKDGKAAYQWEGHVGSVFRVVGDRLYYAEFKMTDTGGSVVCVDLTTGKVVWRTALEALGPIAHEQYGNRMNLDASDDVVTVMGNETAGRYIEYKDAKTGKTVGHKVFKEEKTPAK